MSHQARIALLAILLIAAAVRVRYFTGLQVGDDIVYSHIAAQRVQGNVVFTNIHETRTGFLLPIIASYAIFGQGEVPLVLYNLLCSVGLVAVVFFLGLHLFGERGGWMSGAVAALHPNLVYYATECHTDTAIAFWQALIILVFVLALKSERPRKLLILAGLLLGWAYLHKVSAVFLIPFFVGHWIITKRRWSYYLPIALPALGVFLAELAAFWVLTGNPFERFRLIRYWHSSQYMAEHYTTAGSILFRLFPELPMRLFAPTFGHNTHGVINIACGLAGIALLARRTSGAGLLAGWWITIYLLFSFWPSSFSPFLPGFFLFEWTFPVFAAPLAVLMGGTLARWRPRSAAALAVALCCVSLFCIHRSWTLGREVPDGSREAYSWVTENNPSHVIADDKTVEALRFYEGLTSSRRYTAFQDLENYQGAVLIVDRVWTNQSTWMARPITVEVKSPPRSWEVVYESRRLIIYRP